ncbi:MAG: hypothetical protein KIT84_15680 [Labilithrix sp.]|nr:hypothetical protein [Labilithrix sp.]MCW5812467.1 hypothetical protein [Labilithrix sp.]
MIRSRLLRIAGLAALTTLALGAEDAAAQQPYYPPPQQPYPQQPPPGYQPYQPYPNQPPPGYQPYPNQPPPGYQPGYQPYQPYTPPPPPIALQRTNTEMLALYVTGALYGVGTGIWLDALFKIKDPGLAVIMPIGFGAAVPIGFWAVDEHVGRFPRGVPSATAAGLVLGGLEGMAIAGTQWQYTREKGNDWDFRTQTTVTFLLATGGGVGGFAFGEWLHPDPRNMLFIGSGAGWGAVSGSLFGIAVQGRHDDWKDGSSLAGLIGYNVGLVGAGAISVFHTPSLQSQKYMWLGYGAGLLAGCLVFPFYLFVDDPVVKRGFIGPSLGGAAGAAVAGALTWNMRDAGDVQAKQWTPPVDLAVTPIPALTPAATSHSSQASRSLMQLVGPDPRFSTAPGGAMISAAGAF